ncbi:tellurite resistance TerB C-terminal domain-containing protein [Flavobacterium sp. RSP29]|uniref:tellurite resistance TerB C-terminal domain-containing protein n=1 Tax=Flavobacterium sp. RSP29 TaxID=3401731 RepID=UPI003AAEA3A9
MTILIIIGIIILFVAFGKSKPTTKPTNYYDSAKNPQFNKATTVNRTSKVKITITGPASNTTNMDDSIIDIGSQSYKIDSDYGLVSKVPYWSHSYVYNYSEINYATTAQKKFYQDFKTKFLSGEYSDLEGNTNYVFILLFDLLNEFDKHKDVTKLELQLEILGDNYPKTKSYGVNFLIKKMQEVGDDKGVARLREDHYDYNSQVTYSTFEWRNKYKKKLSLTKEETNILDKIWYSSNNFVSIEYCCIEVIKLYLMTIKKLQQTYIDSDSSIEKEFEEIADVVVRKHFRYRKGSNNYKYAMQSSENEFHTNIFKYCENAVREYYGHKRKISIDPYSSSPEAKEEFETKLINKITQIHLSLISKINLPDEETEIKLNLLNTTRWKIKFDQITLNFNKNPKEFVSEIIVLGNLNIENPSVENIFFEASKFIAKYDQETALLLYIHYLYHDMKSVTFDNKQLTKTIQKSLFKNDNQVENFQVIVSEFINDKDFKKAINSVSQVYAIKRKKIQLDKSLIKEVQKQHSGTVELLNEYLKDDGSEDSENKPKIEEQIEIKITQRDREPTVSIYSEELLFKPIHTTTLETFAKHNFSILQSEFESFAKSNGAFKNQLIENINEICFDILDDLLIEEDEDYYSINQDYYQKLLA